MQNNSYMTGTAKRLCRQSFKIKSEGSTQRLLSKVFETNVHVAAERSWEE